MPEPRAGIPAELTLEFTEAVWRTVQDGDPPSTVALQHVLDRLPEGRGEELNAFLDRLDELGPDQRRRFTAAIDEVQIRSKLWLVDELAQRRALAGTTMVVLGAWFGILPLLLNWRLARPPARMVCVDIEADACTLGKQVIGALYDNVEYHVADAMTWGYSALARDPSTTLVNTICEHLPEAVAWWERVPAGQFVVLQSNNYDLCPDHVNWVRSVEEMKAQTPLARPLFEGTLPLPIFDRFMLIGHR